MAEFFLDRQHVGEHLCRMILIRQSVPYRNFRIFCQLFYNLLTESTILNSLIHTGKNTGCIFNALFFADLGTGRIQIRCSHTEIVCSYLEGTAGSGAGFLEDQRNVFTAQGIHRNAFLFLLLQLCGQIQQIGNLFRCKIFQCQKIASF